MDKRIFEAFDNIKTEKELKQKTMQNLSREMERRKSTRHFSMQRMLAFTAAFVTLCAVALSSLYFTPYAYMDIDVNPSIAITVNRFNRVIRANAYNDDGSIILNDVNVKNKNYEESAKLLIESMISKGYVQKAGSVSITLQSNDIERETLMISELDTAITKTLDAHHLNTDAEVYAVSKEVVDLAHGHHVTPARYMVINDLQEIDDSITYEGCSGHSLDDLRQQQNNNRNRHNQSSNASSTQSDDENSNKHAQSQNGNTHRKGHSH